MYCVGPTAVLIDQLVPSTLPSDVSRLLHTHQVAGADVAESKILSHTKGSILRARINGNSHSSISTKPLSKG